MSTLFKQAGYSMNGGVLMGIMTLAFLIFFVGWALWAYWPSRKEAMREAAMLPFDDGDDR